MGAAPLAVLQESVSVPPPVKTVVVPLTLVIALMTHPISSAVQRPPVEIRATADGPTSVQGLQSLVSPPVYVYILENDISILTSIYTCCRQVPRPRQL